VARVVVVEDQQDERETIALVLHQAGHDVTEAADGREGLGLVLAIRPDIVVSDITMPRMTGTEMCRRIRGDARIRTVPVVLFGGHPLADDDTDGATAVLTKPFTNTELRDCVDRVLQDGHGRT
jgi:CheY-like chemotaxis protein